MTDADTARPGRPGPRVRSGPTMAQRDEPVTVTLAGVARLTGVGRAAVSNWRRRHDDFPSRVAGTDASPQFSLDSVEEWLTRHGKDHAVTSGWERLWPRIEDLGDRDRMGRLIAHVGMRLSEGGAMPAQYTAPDVSDAERALARRASPPTGGRYRRR